MRAPDTIQDAATLALGALAWTLSDSQRAQRLLDVTGLDPADLRARAADAAVLVAVLDFLQAYQPDLIACAAAIETSPERLIAAREALA